MKIQFKKQKNKPPTLHITRSDGSQTWVAFKHNFIQHDLTHFAAETVLNWKDGFYGLIEKGANIEDFEKENRAHRPNLSSASIQMEYIVNLLETELYQQQVFTNFNEQLAKNCQDNNHPIPAEIANEKLLAIRTKLKSLIKEWNMLPLGATLSLDW